MKHGRPEWDDVIAVADLSLDWASDRRGWRREHAHRVWQAAQAIVMVAYYNGLMRLGTGLPRVDEVEMWHRHRLRAGWRRCHSQMVWQAITGWVPLALQVAYIQDDLEGLAWERADAGAQNDIRRLREADVGIRVLKSILIGLRGY